MESPTGRILSTSQSMGSMFISSNSAAVIDSIGLNSLTFRVFPLSSATPALTALSSSSRAAIFRSISAISSAVVPLLAVSVIHSLPSYLCPVSHTIQIRASFPDHVYGYIPTRYRYSNLWLYCIQEFPIS